MRKNLIDFSSYNIAYQVGSENEIAVMQNVPALKPFDDKMISFINEVSKKLMSNRQAKSYPDIMTLAFWMRRASVEEIKKRFVERENVFRLGRGRVFHIAPSNVPVNYAYSLITGLICGNANVVKIPSKEFPQVEIINQAINEALEDYKDLIPYIVLVKYGHEKDINDAFSVIADVRVIWGGDETIREIRKSEMNPRGTEITFADRYSIAVINADDYMEYENKDRIANDFYNDTFLTDQNACTSPRVVIWTGEKVEEAKQIFWGKLYKIVKARYELQPVQAVNKLTSSYLLAANKDYCVEKEDSPDNLIVRMSVNKLSSDLMDFKDNSGYFFEYKCKNILELKDICNDLRCQTISYMGEKRKFVHLLESGISGVDRIVPIGKTMDFEFIWDGYNLFERLTRIISIV